MARRSCGSAWTTSRRWSPPLPSKSTPALNGTLGAGRAGQFRQFPVPSFALLLDLPPPNPTSSGNSRNTCQSSAAPPPGPPPTLPPPVSSTPIGAAHSRGRASRVMRQRPSTPHRRHPRHCRCPYHVSQVARSRWPRLARHRALPATQADPLAAAGLPSTRHGHSRTSRDQPNIRMPSHHATPPKLWLGTRYLLRTASLPGADRRGGDSPKIAFNQVIKGKPVNQLHPTGIPGDNHVINVK